MKRTLKGRKYLGIAGCAAMLAFAPKTVDAEELTVSPRQVESSVKQQKAKSVSFSKRKVVFKHISKRLKIDKKGRHLTKYTLEWEKSIWGAGLLRLPDRQKRKSEIGSENHEK